MEIIEINNKSDFGTEKSWAWKLGRILHGFSFHLVEYTVNFLLGSIACLDTYLLSYITGVPILRILLIAPIIK